MVAILTVCPQIQTTVGEGSSKYGETTVTVMGWLYLYFESKIAHVKHPWCVH